MYENRTDAGNKLVDLLKTQDLDFQKVMIGAIPNGGIQVAIPIASYLSQPLYVLIARKIQYPWTTEAGFGAMTGDGIKVLNTQALSSARMSKEVIEIQSKKTLKDIEEREKKFGKFLLPSQIENGHIILVDDGLASGITMQAACTSLIQKKISQLTVVVPTAHSSSISRLKRILKKKSDIPFHVLSPDIQSGFSFAVANAYKVWYDESSLVGLNLLNEYREQYIKNLKQSK